MKVALFLLGIALAAFGALGMLVIEKRDLNWYCARANVPLGLGLAVLQLLLP